MVMIHVHQSGEAGIFANAYLVETDKSLIAVDATLTVTEARIFGERIRALKKPIVAVLITHAHPDHIAGLSVWLPHDDVPIYVLPNVTQLLREIEQPKRAQWQPVFKNEWVLKWTLPNRVVKDGGLIKVDDVVFHVHELGPGGDCDANSTILLHGTSPAAFVGDLIFNGMHSYLADGHIKEWLQKHRPRTDPPQSRRRHRHHFGYCHKCLLRDERARPWFVTSMSSSSATTLRRPGWATPRRPSSIRRP
jgi:glyoxylase-like metal-dependent hydrolase (beta-lactamase superfamily II)